MAIRFSWNEGNIFATVSARGRDEVNGFMNQVALRARVAASTGPYATGRLAASVRTIGPTTTVTEVRGRVGSSLNYAASVDRGAAVHVIRARRSPKMIFYWRRVARVVSFSQVNHPGQEAKLWLTRPTVQTAALRGWRVVLRDISGADV